MSTSAMRSGNSSELQYIFVKMYRENRYILIGTFRYIFGIGIGTGNRLVSVVRKFSENLTENTSHFRSRFTMYTSVNKLNDSKIRSESL